MKRWPIYALLPRVQTYFLTFGCYPAVLSSSNAADTLAVRDKALALVSIITTESKSESESDASFQNKPVVAK